MPSFEWSKASFRTSLVPMVLADDERRYVAANAAACLLLRVPEQAVFNLKIEDLTPIENRALVEPLWQAFLRDRVQQGTFALSMPDGARLEVDYSATAHVEPGLHLSILMFPPSGSGSEPLEEEPRPAVLTDRERQILAMVAMGRGSSWIAAELGVSASTVETHVRNFMTKLGARNRAHAIALAVQRDEISLELDSPPRENWG